MSSLFRRQGYADEGCKRVDKPPRVPLAHTISICPQKSILRFAGAKHALPAQHLHLLLLHALPSQHSHLLLLHESTAQDKTKAQTRICLINIVLLSMHTFLMFSPNRCNSAPSCSLKPVNHSLKKPSPFTEACTQFTTFLAETHSTRFRKLCTVCAQ